MSRITQAYSVARQLTDFVGLAKKQIYAAAASALNRAAVTARGEAIRIVREREKKVRASAAKAQISIIKAKPGQGERMRAALNLKTSVSLLAAAKVREVTVIAYAGKKVVPIFQGKGKPPAFRMMDGERKGVVVAGVDTADRAFKARVGPGKMGIFVRRGDQRLPIQSLTSKGPIGLKFFEEPEVRDRITRVFAAAFKKNLDHELDRRKQGNREKRTEEAMSAVFGD